MAVNIDSIVISKSIETKTNINNLIRTKLREAIRPLILMPKMSRYIKTFRVQVGDKDQKKKIMSYFKSDDEV